jgi:hypothetical protein
MEKYYEKKAIRNGSIRNCIKCKGKLSRYNQGSSCSICEKNSSSKLNSKILEMLDEIG